MRSRQLVIELENSGEEIGVQVVGRKVTYGVGDYVRLFTGPGGETQVREAKPR